MRKFFIALLAIIVLGVVAAYFYGFEKLGRQITALRSANPEYAKGDWRELYAYEVGKDAVIYGYPAMYWSNIRYRFVEKPERNISMGVNELWQTEIPPLPENKYGGSPNRDTRYGFCWTDLTNDAAIITVPENPTNRYYSVQLVEMYSDLYGYIGTRATNNVAGEYLVVGPGFKGDTTGYKGVYRSPTNWSFITVRVYTIWDAPQDVAKTKTLLDQFKINMLSEKGKIKKPYSRDVMDVFDAKEDPLFAIKMINEVMIQNPPPSRDDALMQKYALVGMGSRGTTKPDTLHPSIQKGLRRAVVDAIALLKNASIQYASITNQNTTSNQWIWGPKNLGRTAESGDFFGRAGSQCMIGLMEHWIEECVKARTFNDTKGRPLDGKYQYKMHFTKEQLPKPIGFWSLTAYTDEYNLVPNDYKINSLGTYTKTFKYNQDGSLDIYFQADKPAPDKAGNWHPVEKGQPFNVFFRQYIPEQSWLDQSYVVPGIERI